MTDKKAMARKMSGHSRVSSSSSRPVYLKTGPVKIKPVQNIMFELDSTSKQGPSKIDNINDKAIGLAPFIREQTKTKNTTINSEPMMNQSLKEAPLKDNHLICQKTGKSSTNIVTSHQTVKQASLKTDQQKAGPTKTGAVNKQASGSSSKNNIPRSSSFGSFTIAELAHVDELPVGKIEPRYHAGVLQGNWHDERLHPRYRPMHPPPLNSCSLDYRSTYKEDFLNHNLTDISSVQPVKRDNSLAPWFVHDEADKTRKDQGRVPAPAPTVERRDGKDPHKGDDPDPFKRRDVERRGYEYQLDAFQGNPRLWERYHGRDSYFGRRRFGGARSASNELMQESGDGPVSAAVRGGEGSRTQRDEQVPGPVGADKTQDLELGHVEDIRHDPDLGISRVQEANPKKPDQTIYTEYKSSFQPSGINAAASIALRRERERACASARNISTFAF